MAHYAFIDSNNIVVKVFTGVDETITQSGVGGSSEAWEQFYESQEWNAGLTCKRTSYNNNIRKQYAGIGYTYDESRDAFLPPKANCHPEEVLNEDTCTWSCANAEHTPVAPE